VLYSRLVAKIFMYLRRSTLYFRRPVARQRYSAPGLHSSRCQSAIHLLQPTAKGPGNPAIGCDVTLEMCSSPERTSYCCFNLSTFMRTPCGLEVLLDGASDAASCRGAGTIS
jgi:hypothetical protein